MICFDSLPPEIVRIIWRHFNRTDLLNIRLVCRSWNKASLRLLQNSAFRLHLYNEVGVPYENCLEKFLEFATAREFKTPQFVLPFVLHFKAFQYNEWSDNLNLFISNVQILLELFGQTCVKHLEIWIHSKQELYFENVLKLLSLVSNGLEELTWRGFKKTPEIPPITFAEEILKNHTHLTFPQLNRLALTSYTCEEEDNTFWKFLMPKAPKLQEIEFETLQIPNDIHRWTWPISLPVNLVTKLKVHNFHEYSPNILHQFGQNELNLSPLRTLELRLDVAKFVKNPEELSRIGEFLKQFSSTLVCLTLEFNVIYGGEDNSSEPECIFPFPIFPRLRYLKMTKSWQVETLRIICNESNLFPALEHLEVQHDLVLHVNDDLGLGLGQVFPSVKFITLLISPRNQIFLNHDKYMNEFLIKFPQLSKISLVNDFINNCNIAHLACEGGRMKCFLNALIQSNQTTKLEEIELVDCPKNYLGIVLAQKVKGPRLTLENLPTDTGKLKDQLIAEFQRFTGIADFEIIESKNENGKVTSFCAHPRKGEGGGGLENVKMIKLSVSTRGRRALKIVPLQLQDLHIADMSDVCPRLEQIHISPLLVGQGQGQDSEAQAKLLQEISVQFPKLIVNFY